MDQSKSEVKGLGLEKPNNGPVWKLVAGTIAGVALLALLHSNGPLERLTELPRGTNDWFFAVHQGRVYFQQYRRGPRYAVASIGVHGERPLRLLTLPVQPEELQFTDAGLFYTTTEPVVSAPRLSLAASPRPSTNNPAPTTTARPVSVDQRTWPRLPRKRKVWIPLSGGTPKELIPLERASSVQVRGGYCYWVRSARTGPGEPLVLPKAEKPWGDLLVAPLTGGPPRRIARIPDDSALQPCGAGVCWRDGSPNRRTLLSTCPPDFNIEAFPNFRASWPQALVGDRLCWLNAGADPPTPESQQRQSVASARRDGSDYRVLLDLGLRSNNTTRVNELFNDGPSLYFAIDRLTGSKPMRQIVRQRVEAGSKPETLLETTNVGLYPIGVDQGFLYLVSWEERENWFDWSQAGLRRRRVGVLCRVRLSSGGGKS